MGIECDARMWMIRTSPRKLGLVADMIRGKKAADAVRSLAFCNRRVKHEVLKCLRSAIANASNNFGMDVDRLQIVKVDVGRSKSIRRMVPRGRGRSAMIQKKFSNLHISVVEVF